MQTRVCRLHAQGDIRIESIDVAAPGPGEVRLRMGWVSVAAVVQGVVLELAGLIDPALAEWIKAEGAFPATMVDRIVPATTAAMPTSAYAAGDPPAGTRPS